MGNYTLDNVFTQEGIKKKKKTVGLKVSFFKKAWLENRVIVGFDLKKKKKKRSLNKLLTLKNTRAFKYIITHTKKKKEKCYLCP